jgi:ornithine cyclodeaminase/alanine dehydrogenase-like protein (mu-crystallin family)
VWEREFGHPRPVLPEWYVGPDDPKMLWEGWEQAGSKGIGEVGHGGELTLAVEADVVARADVTELGAVLVGEAEGRRADEITLFDSTGLAIQDLVIAKAALAKVDDLYPPMLDL